MGFFGRLLGTIPYFLCFCCAAIILGFYSYFLSVLSDRNITIPRWEKAVEGISGVAVVYTILAVVLTPCLGGVRLLAFLGMLADIALCAGFIAIAVMTRHGAQSCSGIVDTPLGRGDSATGNGFGSDGFGTGSDEKVTYQAKYGTACRFNKACFAVAIIGAIFFLIAAVAQFLFARRQQKEKRFGPSPANNYTSGSGKRAPFWRRNKKVDNGDSELGTFGAGVPATAVGGADVVGTHRPSDETGYTGTTAVPADHNRYEAYKPADAEYGGYNSHTNGYTNAHTNAHSNF